MPDVVFLSSPALWQRGHGPEHPLKPERLRRTHELLEELGSFEASNVRLVEPRPATDKELTLFHTSEYVDIVRALSGGATTIASFRYGFGSGDNPVFAGMYDSEGLKVGSAIQGARMLVDGACDIAFSYSGGLHHGGPDFASGFCVFNDAAVAIQWLLEQGLKVAYVDIDVHHGDGVQNAFYDSAQALTVSLHQDGRTLFPGSGYIEESGSGAGEGFCINVPLPPYTDDESYLLAFREIVPPALRRFEADIVVTQLGVDTHVRDPLASLALTTAGQVALFQALRDLAPRWLALGGGGYAIDVVPRAWTLAFGVMADLDLPAELPPHYRSRYGGRWLRDQENVELDEAVRQRIHASVRKIVAAVKQKHGLHG
jgi:acetoin utilization protein AcuC